MNDKRPLIIYHGNCADGFTAAWAAWRHFEGRADYHAGVYQDAPPDVTEREVYLLDFSYKYPVVMEMLKTASSITILDHHKSAAEELQNELSIAGCTGYALYGKFDMEKSGARLAWEHFHPDREVPALVKIVEDRDLWRFALEGTREIQAVIFSYPYDFAVWDNLAGRCESDRATLIAEGAAIERKHFKDVRELVQTFKRRMVIGGVEVWAANLPYTLTSDAGNLMAKGEPFAACYWDTPDGRVFSLRSLPEGADVSEIAKRYGGGGHKNASGFRLPHGASP